LLWTTVVLKHLLQVVKLSEKVLHLCFLYLWTASMDSFSCYKIFSFFFFLSGQLSSETVRPLESGPWPSVLDLWPPWPHKKAHQLLTLLFYTHIYPIRTSRYKVSKGVGSTRQRRACKSHSRLWTTPIWGCACRATEPGTSGWSSAEKCQVEVVRKNVRLKFCGKNVRLKFCGKNVRLKLCEKMSGWSSAEKNVRLKFCGKKCQAEVLRKKCHKSVRQRRTWWSDWAKIRPFAPIG
jgi:hypothetical protein